MNNELIQKRFEEMGARVKFGDIRAQNRGRMLNGQFIADQQATVSIDIARDKKGEFFQINTFGNPDVEVPIIDQKDRHLLLLHRQETVTRKHAGRKIIELSKFLCGHDETHWFVAAIPEASRVTNINSAKQALKPKEVVLAETKKNLTKDKKAAHLHKNAARRRQGEWFFIPVDKNFKSIEILSNEPIRRGRGKPHMCEELVRFGGITVMVNSRFPNGITVGEYDKMVKNDPAAAKWAWQRMTRDMEVFVRGRITHADHKTVILRQWHKVIPNEETKARAMRNLAFLD